MNKNHYMPNQSRSGLKDIWNSYMCLEARYSINDIPFCPTIITDLPKDIITLEEAKLIHKNLSKQNASYFCDKFVCFYLDDYKFDSPRSGIWFNPKKSLNLLNHFKGIITPDFSTYQDFPHPLKLWNTYRMRAFGYWVGKQGLEVINNVRWGTFETFSYCFDGIEKNSVVAIGTVGGSPKKIADRLRFELGLFEMVKKLCPHTIIVYGSAKYNCFTKLKEQGIRIISFESNTAKYYKKGKRYE